MLRTYFAHFILSRVSCNGLRLCTKEMPNWVPLNCRAYNRALQLGAYIYYAIAVIYDFATTAISVLCLLKYKLTSSSSMMSKVIEMMLYDGIGYFVALAGKFSSEATMILSLTLLVAVNVLNLILYRKAQDIQTAAASLAYCISWIMSQRLLLHLYDASREHRDQSAVEGFTVTRHLDSAKEVNRAVRSQFDRKSRETFDLTVPDFDLITDTEHGRLPEQLEVQVELSAYNTQSSTDDHLFVRTHVAAYFVSLLLCEFLQAISSIISTTWLTRHGVTFGETCVTQGVLKQTSDIGQALWTLASVLFRTLLDDFVMFIAALASIVLYVLVFLRLRGNIIRNGWRLKFRKQGASASWRARNSDNKAMSVAKQMLLTAIFLLSGLVNVLLFLSTRALIPTDSMRIPGWSSFRKTSNGSRNQTTNPTITTSGHHRSDSQSSTETVVGTEPNKKLSRSGKPRPPSLELRRDSIESLYSIYDEEAPHPQTPRSRWSPDGSPRRKYAFDPSFSNDIWLICSVAQDKDVVLILA
ncbi:hypothetical protein H0H93_007912 [Arthromyces matolae]|nr:hypothetical protein H0H93_007912 [Arthromyces matolae]